MFAALRKPLFAMVVGSICFITPNPPQKQESSSVKQFEEDSQTLTGENGSNAPLLILVVRDKDTGEPLEANVSVTKPPFSHSQIAFGGTAQVICDSEGSFHIGAYYGNDTYQRYIWVTDSLTWYIDM